MVKVSIAYYKEDRTPIPLAKLNLRPRKFIEHIFDAVEDAHDFEDITSAFKQIIADKIEYDRETDRYVRYIVTDPAGNQNYLKVKVRRQVCPK